MSAPHRDLSLLAILGLVAVQVTACSSHTNSTQPSTREPAGPLPSAIFSSRQQHNPPELKGTGEQARQSVHLFIRWAAASVPSEREDGRRAIQQAAGNPEIAKALVEEFASAPSDYTRGLIVLSILGELRNETGQEFLVRLVHEPLPPARPGVEGVTPERHVRELLQAKAVDGIAYARTAKADAEVLAAAGTHPSRIVRAEAISAFLWNHEDSAAARELLARHVRPEERVFLDRVRRETGTKAAAFNDSLKAYLAAHPELRPPPPGRRPPDQAQKKEQQGPTASLQPPRI